MLAVSKELDLPFEKCPTVSTIDGMQGREADIIILDWVVTNRDQLGFTSQNRRANVALTCARRCLITVAHGGLLDEEKGFGKRQWTFPPEILAHWAYLSQLGVVVRCPAVSP
jgi:hypothetical protein